MSARAVSYACVTFDHAVIFPHQWCPAFLSVHMSWTLVTVLAVSVYYLLFLYQNSITYMTDVGWGFGYVSVLFSIHVPHFSVHTWQTLVTILAMCPYCSLFLYNICTMHM